MDRVVRRFRYIRDHFGRIANRPSGIVEVWPGSGRVRGNGDPPAPIQNLRRAQPGSIEDCLILTRRARWLRLAPVWAEKPWMPLKSKALHRTQQEHGDRPKKRPTHFSSGIASCSSI